MNAPAPALPPIPAPEDHPDLALAARHAPRIRFDAREPFLPDVVGVTVFREHGPSPSFPRQLQLPPVAAIAIEYAIFWDWEIQHLYELEHIWLYLDENERLIAADASWHGEWHAMKDENGALPLSEDGRLCLYSEPGKHAFAASPAAFQARRPATDLSCGARAGAMGVHVTPLYEERLRPARTPDANQLVHTWLEQRRFAPSYEFSREFALEEAPLLPWPALAQWIPGRVHAWLAQLAETYPRGQRRVLRIGHRGASAHEPENTLASFRKAAALGCDMVEMDLRVTADKVPVILHDDSLRRTFGISRPVIDLTWQELREQAPDLPSLDEAVATCKSLGLGIYLEIKYIHYESGAAALEILRRHDYLHATIVASFRVDWLAAIKRACPQLPISVLFGFANIDAIALARAVGAEYVHACWDLEPNNLALMSEEWLAAVHDAGLGVICWTQLSAESSRQLRAKGVHALTADDPNFML